MEGGADSTLLRLARAGGVLAIGLAIFGGLWWYVTKEDAPPAPPPAPAETAPPESVQTAYKPPPPIASGCRALSIEGRARRVDLARAREALAGSGSRDGGAGDAAAVFVATGEPLDGLGWIELEQPSFSVPRLVVKAAKSGRESAFAQAGVVRPCIDDEGAWLVQGRFHTLGGAGDAPGGEQWIVTPAGVARVGVAGAGVGAGRKGEGSAIEVRVEQGPVVVWLAKDAEPELVATDADGGGAKLKAPPVETLVTIAPGQLLTARAPALGAKEIESSVAACEREAGAAAAAAKAITPNDGREGGLDGEAIAAAMKRRGSARAACHLAELRVALGGAEPARAERVLAAKKAAFSAPARD